MGEILACARGSEQPPHAAIGMPDTELGLIGAGVLSRLPDHLPDRIPVVAMDDSLEVRRSDLERFLVDPEDRLLPLVPDAIAVREIPVPRSHLSRRQREIAALFAVPKLPGRLLQRGGAVRDPLLELGIEPLEF